MPWDAFALELWGPLLTGGTCVLVTERPLTPAGLRETVAKHGVNTVFLTTSLFHLLVEEDPGAFAGLRTLMVGGEKLSAPHAARLLAAWPQLRLVNGYGPVESAVFVLAHRVRVRDTAAEIPLGRPVPRTEAADAP
ncbi:AMP-binding protein [Streptacidiphilus sp. 4-A2]|nr:AMP-binding protein [Streptacidiphilus sp. 4-A2]